MLRSVVAAKFSPQLLQTRHLRWFGHASRHNPGISIGEAISQPTLPGWCKRLGGKLWIWLGTIIADAEVLPGPHIYDVQRWRRDWFQRTQELANNRRAWAATIRNLVNNESDSIPCIYPITTATIGSYSNQRQRTLRESDSKWNEKNLEELEGTSLDNPHYDSQLRVSCHYPSVLHATADRCSTKLPSSLVF